MRQKTPYFLYDMETKKLKEFDKQKGFDWLVWPQAYFDAAIIGCDWLIETSRHEIHGRPKNSEIYQSIQPSQYLVLPIIYNFKHGIEIYLKGLLAVFQGEYDNNNHDLISLLNLLISRIREKGKSSAEKTKILQALDGDVRKIIKRYYFGLYLGGNRYQDCPDIKNQAERYPETKSGDSYDIPDSFSCWVQTSVGKEKPLNEIDIESIKDDISKIKSILRNTVGKQISFKKI